MAHTAPDLSTAVWHKSSYSNTDGGDCVEVARHFPGAAHWRKSSYSNTDGGNCVEVADNVPGLVPVRDSKVTEGPVLLLASTAWAPFVSAVKGGGLRG
ncbi:MULTISPECIES: DUF397 domain-containing protein [Streptomyces]|uniref:DUF397 domain-containing protein n=1 Tax=Streptomyces lichenis TaxID=2306967 RepID=A0ABT0I4A8_9ACTN|nr:DUF397 domain-containing protein [Streptomyces lichenis]MCK8676159.1 DUF397 domain-containing protein [Streptomyces lichenis]